MPNANNEQDNFESIVVEISDSEQSTEIVTAAGDAYVAAVGKTLIEF